MTNENRITLILEGVPEAEGRIRLNTFVNELQNLSSALGRISREAADGTPVTVFQVEELSYNSPMRVVVAPAPGHEQVASQVLHRFDAVADAVTSGANLDSFDADLLSNMRGLAKPVGRQLKYATLLINDKHFEITDAITSRIDAALAIDEECIGFIEGRLEQINIHGGANTFHIYPDIGARKVACHFPNSLLDDAIYAVGRRVEISGTLKYRHAASFPYEIAVTSIDSFPPEDELPAWDDLRGRAPDATGALSSEAFVRELRDGW
ncbi:hypothetical protein B1B_10992 [mine drainage metagenome]|uniref:Uncharacterized protein n=1 Tax=mine drainage metagenome TaxID=410659 RepID=T1A3P2_9ZZZZ